MSKSKKPELKLSKPVEKNWMDKKTIPIFTTEMGKSVRKDVTVREFMDAYNQQNKLLQGTIKIAQDVIKAFYKSSPEDEFFKACDKNLLDYAQGKRPEKIIPEGREEFVVERKEKLDIGERWEEISRSLNPVDSDILVESINKTNPDAELRVRSEFVQEIAEAKVEKE